MDRRGAAGSSACDRREEDRIDRAAASWMRQRRARLERGAAGDRTGSRVVGNGGRGGIRTYREVPECGEANRSGDAHSGACAGGGNGAAVLGFGYRMHLSGGSEALLVPGTYDSPIGHRGPAGFAILRRQVWPILGPPSASAQWPGWQLSALRQTTERRRPLGYYLVRRGSQGIPRPLSEAERAAPAAGGARSH